MTDDIPADLVEHDVGIAMRIAAVVSRDVAELPDRTSPPDEPMLLLVTERELQDILMPRIADAIREERIRVLREAGVPEMAEALRQAQAFLFATGYATPVQETVAAALSRYRGEG